MLAPPTETTLPFFAYGVFKPGELAFLQIKEFVISCEKNCSIPGELLIRDGLPIVAPRDGCIVRGVLIQFRPKSSWDAYQRIANLEPEKQYRWEVAKTSFGEANYLAGRSPAKGSMPMEIEWCGRRDPLFVEALEVVTETVENNKCSSGSFKALFRLEMAYLLLWTAIERYASLRYHLGDKATKKVLAMAGEPAFKSALTVYGPQNVRKVQRADDPTVSCELNLNLPKEALEYYYQVRSNLVHRGKGDPSDFPRIRDSLIELLEIFRATREAAFEESNWQEELE